MTFLNHSALWPVDITGNSIFLVKAVQKIGRSLGTVNTRLPPCVYKYDVKLPKFADASEDDKALATDILLRNTSDEHVPIFEKAFYSEQSEKSVIIRNCLISERQWNKAIGIADFSKTVSDDNIMRVIAITAAIFQGVATGNVRAKDWPIDTPESNEMPASWFNTYDESVIKARLSLGNINKHYPLDTNNRGISHIFLDKKSLEKWRLAIGNSMIRIEFAFYAIKQHIASKPKGWVYDLKKEDVLSENIAKATLTEVEKEKLWEKLPDHPFKIQGARPEPIMKGSAKNRTSGPPMGVL